MPSSVATSRLGRPCSDTIMTAPSRNASSYLGGAPRLVLLTLLLLMVLIPSIFLYTECFFVL